MGIKPLGPGLITNLWPTGNHQSLQSSIYHVILNASVATPGSHSKCAIRTLLGKFFPLGRTAEWQNGRMAEWKNGRMAGRQNGRMEWPFSATVKMGLTRHIKEGSHAEWFLSLWTLWGLVISWWWPEHWQLKPGVLGLIPSNCQLFTFTNQYMVWCLSLKVY